MISTQTLHTRTREILSILRLGRSDASTADERSSERDRRIMLTVAASFVARGITVVATLISVPLTLNYLGVERYGLWMTISSFTALLGFADFGIGNGILNAISEAYGRDDRRMAGEYVSSGIFLLSGVAILLAVIFAAAYPWLDWRRIFNVTSYQAGSESGPAAVVFMLCLLASIPLGVAQRVQWGYQEGFANSAWQVVSSLTSLLGLVVVIYLRSGLPFLVLAISGGQLVALFLQSLSLFVFSQPWLRPAWQRITGTAVRQILRLGMLFFALQLAVALAYASDNLVAAQVLGSDAVAELAVAMRLFSIPTILLTVLYMPLWPAYREAIARGDSAWVKKTLVKSLWVSVLVAGVPSLVFIAFGKFIIKVWVGPSVEPPFFLMLGLGVWTILGAAGNALAMFLNGANVLKFQLVSATLMSTSALAAKIGLARLIGVAGIPMGTVFAYLIFTTVPSAIYVPRLLRTMWPGQCRGNCNGL